MKGESVSNRQRVGKTFRGDKAPSTGRGHGAMKKKMKMMMKKMKMMKKEKGEEEGDWRRD